MIFIPDDVPAEISRSPPNTYISLTLKSLGFSTVRLLYLKIS